MAKRGRPSIRPQLTPVLRRLLRKERLEDPADPHYGLTNAEALVRVTLELALKGDPAALKLVWERIDGRVPEPVLVSGQDGAGPVKVVVEYVTTTLARPEDREGPEDAA